ncbi:hypothetical protein DRN76_05560 [Methanosarcinales archaeon]|nr:MAG: hypothetical protein DRN76_05560 [Methanosarcinales archaeon]
MSKIKTTNHCGVVLSSTGLDRSQYTIVFTIAMILCILAPNSGAASESTPLIDYTISASPSPEAPLVVDDDLEVKVNGETVFIDDDRYATLDGRASWKGEPITFSALPGDELEIIATNPGGGEIELSALYLHADRESVQLSDGVPNAPGGDLYEFFEERFTITIPAPSPLVYILGRPVSVHGGEDLDVKVGWSNIPEGWKLVVSLEKSETDKNRLADDIERIIRTDSGEDVFKLKVYPVNETYNQAKVWACLFDESDNWASVFTNANMTILPAQNPSPSPKPPTYPLAAAAITLIALVFAITSRKKKRPESTVAEPAPPEPEQTQSISPPEPIPPPTAPTTPFTTLRTVWDPSNKDFVWDAGKPDEYGELPRIKRWIEDKNPNIYWFLLKIANHTDHPVTEWNVTLYTEQALTITEAHLDEKQVRIVKSDFDTDSNRNVCVVAIPPELGVSIPANGGRRSMYFKIDIRCEDALKMEFGVFGVVKLGKSPQIEVPIREKRFTYACKYGDFRNMYYGSIDALASMAITNLQDSYNCEIVRNFTNSFRLIRDFEKYCNDRYAESEVLIEKLEVVRSSLKAAEPITKEEILPLVEENLTALRMMSGVEAQKERGVRMCEKLIELLHIATSKIK